MTEYSPEMPAQHRLSRRLALGALVGGAAATVSTALVPSIAHAATTLTSVATYAALAALPLTSPMEPVIVRGRASAADGGEGVFVWVAGAPAGADGGTQIASTTSSAGLWRRQMNLDSPLSARWFGVVADGSTDDTAAFQSAVNAAVKVRRPLSVPTGVVRITGVISMPSGGTARQLVLLGSGPSESQFKLTGSGRFDLDLGASSEWPAGTEPATAHLVLRDFSIRCDTNQTVTALTARFARASGVTSQTSIVENIEITGTSETTGPLVGIHLVDASALRFRGARIQGRRQQPGYAAGSIGVRLTGNSIPVEMYLSEINVYFVETAFFVDGEATGRLEGVQFDQCAAVACDHGVIAGATDQSLWVKVSNCHFNTKRGGITLRNYGNYVLSGNVIYGGGGVPYVAVSLSNNGGAGIGTLSVISDNVMIYQGSTSVAKNGIVVAGAASEDSILISNNIFALFDTAIVLAPTAERVAIAPTNMYRGIVNTTPVSNSGTSNVVAAALAAW